MRDPSLHSRRAPGHLAATQALRRGFTMLELMIVIGMAALVMSISIPFVQRTIRRDAVYQAVHAVEDACRNARATAIFNNAVAEMVIRPADKAFSVQPGAPLKSVFRSPSSSTPSTTSDAPDAPPKPKGFGGHAPKPFAAQLGDDVNIELLDVNFTEYREGEETRVRFYPNGTSDEFTIVLRIGSTAWRKITLDIVTGLPSLEVIR